MEFNDDLALEKSATEAVDNHIGKFDLLEPKGIWNAVLSKSARSQVVLGNASVPATSLLQPEGSAASPTSTFPSTTWERGAIAKFIEVLG